MIPHTPHQVSSDPRDVALIESLLDHLERVEADLVNAVGLVAVHREIGQAAIHQLYGQQLDLTRLREQNTALRAELRAQRELAA